MKKHENMENISYADAALEIEQILASFNDKSMDVDQMAARVKRAQELITLCKTKLYDAEQSILKEFE